MMKRSEQMMQAVQAGVAVVVEARRQAAQGDVLFLRVEAIPSGYEAQETAGLIVVAHSETGHHHTVPGLEAMLYANRADPMTAYLQMKAGVEAVTVTHHRPHDTHAAIRLLGEGAGGSVWMVRRQREHAPEGWRRVED